MQHLSFDLSESADGVLTLEAMASSRASDTATHAAVMAEVEAVLAWARDEFGGPPGPVEDGYEWDHELLVQQEAGGWVTVTLTFSASPAFAEAFQARFGAPEDD